MKPMFRKCTHEDIEKIKANPLDISIGSYPDFDLDSCSFTYIVDDVVLGCGGIKIFWPGVGDAWIMLNHCICERPILFRIKAIEFIRDKLLELMTENNIRRCGAIVKTDFEKANKLVRFLGFEYEGMMRKFAPDGRDMNIYGLVR